MNKTWALFWIPTNDIVYVCDDLKRIKFIQLLVSRYLPIALGSTAQHTKPQLSEVYAKLAFVNDILELEDTQIDEIYRIREAPHLVQQLQISKEFYNIVYPGDTAVTSTADQEIQRLELYKESCEIHKNFLIKNLYNVDYSAPLADIKKQLAELIYYPPIDEFHVYEMLNPTIAKFLNE